MVKMLQRLWRMPEDMTRERALYELASLATAAGVFCRIVAVLMLVPVAFGIASGVVALPAFAQHGSSLRRWRRLRRVRRASSWPRRVRTRRLPSCRREVSRA